MSDNIVDLDKERALKNRKEAFEQMNEEFKKLKEVTPLIVPACNAINILTDIYEDWFAVFQFPVNLENSKFEQQIILETDKVFGYDFNGDVTIASVDVTIEPGEATATPDQTIVKEIVDTLKSTIGTNTQPYVLVSIAFVTGFAKYIKENVLSFDGDVLKVKGLLYGLYPCELKMNVGEINKVNAEMPEPEHPGDEALEGAFTEH